VPQLGNITFDCDNPARLAEFWSALTGYSLQDSNPFMARLAPPDGSRPHLLFIKVPEPKTAKNRVHLDFGEGKLEPEVERLVGLGASRLGNHSGFGFEWVVLADPEGNEFCVGRPARESSGSE
jgi:catechol 2,3-dioxygenase-like lactoylglutathione lyase family enzyme